MNIEELREYCLLKKGTTESFPFDNETLVFKVSNKMFALVNLTGDLSINLKCDPEKAINLRERYSSISPGFHMNKKHWNTVMIDDNISTSLVLELINHSYDLVLKSLTKKQKESID